MKDFEKVIAPFYNVTLACGLFGISEDFAENYLSLDEKFMRNKEACFFIRSSGDSMEPKIFENDILIVDCSIRPKSESIVAVYLNHNPICKQLIQKDKQIILRSFNSQYKDIIVTEDDEFQVFGTVIGLARDFKS